MTGFAGNKRVQTTKPRDVDLSSFEKDAVRQARVAGEIVSLALELLTPDPDQPRKEFSEESIAELAQSLKENGLFQPIIVRNNGEKGYLISCGERRFRAAKLAGLEKVDAIVRNDVSGLELLRMQVQENEQRENMRPLDLANVYKKAFDALGEDLGSVCEWANKSKSYISSYLTLAEAPEEIRKLSNRVSDASSLQLLVRLSKKSPEEAAALIGMIESGELGEEGGSIRNAIRKKAGVAPDRKEQEEKIKEVHAVMAEWDKQGTTKALLIVQKDGSKLRINLPADFE